MRTIYSTAIFLSVALLFPHSAFGLDASTGVKTTACLIQDQHVQQGVTVYDPVEGAGHRASGALKGIGSVNQPVWGLSQWNSKTPFGGTPDPTEGNLAYVKYDSGSKSITFGAIGSMHGDVTLRMDTSKEYAKGIREKNERWPALYLWQRFDTPNSIAELTSVKFSMDAILHFSKYLRPDGRYNFKSDAAQFSIFLTVQNINKASPNFGRYVWFGIPVYDNRFSMPPRHQQKDAFTKKFIYEVDSSTVANRSLHDGRWVHLQADLLPDIKSSLQQAVNNGFFQQPVSVSEFSIKSINVGWEMPGTFDAEIQFKDLSLCIE